jgi:di/tricarboxylate transporter
MRTRWIIAAVLILVGAVWVGQGLGLFPGSGFMDGDTTWALIGAVLAFVGVVVAWTAFRKRPPA